MLDLDRLDRISFSTVPRFQQFLAMVGLMPQYKIYPRLKIHIEGFDKIAARDEPVYFAMNHTDRYNYFPFQTQLWREYNQFTAVWVKGKYYEKYLIGKIMEWANLIPTPSKGYIITNDFHSTLGRAPENSEYKAIRSRLDAHDSSESMPPLTVDDVPQEILTIERDILGGHFDPADTSYVEFLRSLFRTMMMKFVDLNERAFDTGLNVLVFPQGTRSIRLSRGHIGLAEMAIHLNRTIVPVGCSGSDIVHPGDSPLIKGGEVVYRVGDPIRPEDLQEFVPDEPFVPFTAEADYKHREQFQGYIDFVMERINELVDPPYKFAEDLESDGVKGANRFV
jgi:hypothetical protein